jgi:hypothetical protein
MKRRALLASAGVGMASLTGCLFGGGGGDSEATTTASGSQPLQDVNRSGAKLKLVSIDAPESTQLNEPYEFQLTVKNSGDTAGVYRAPVTVQRKGEVEFREEREALVYVDPGETQSATISLSAFAEVGRANIRLDGADNQWGIEVRRRRLPFGGTFVANGMAITVDRVELEARDGGRENRQWANVYVRVENTGQQNYAPSPDRFYIRYDGVRYSKALYGGASPEYNDVNLRQGQTEAGIIQYTIPESATAEDLQIEFERRNQQAIWLRPDGTDGGSGSGSAGGSGS